MTSPPENDLQENVLLKIESSLPSMQPSEQKIAKVILSNADQAKYMSVSELSLVSHVSEASVIRFVKKLGFQGFQHFKLALAALSAAQEQEGGPSLSGDAPAASLNKYIRDSLILAINDTYSMLKRRNLELAADLICSAKRVFCVAIGPCGVTCSLLAFYLSELGLSIHYYPDPIMQIQNVTFSTPEDVVIAISHSGTTTDTLRILEIARANQTKVITITHYMKSPIIDLTDVLLCSYARPDPHEIFNATSQVAQIYVMEALNAYIRIKMGGELAERQKKVKENQAIKFGHLPPQEE